MSTAFIVLYSWFAIYILYGYVSKDIEISIGWNPFAKYGYACVFVWLYYSRFHMIWREPVVFFFRKLLFDRRKRI